MSSTVSLRIASVLTVIHAALHTIGGVLGKPASQARQAAVAAMQSNQFVAMGATRSYWEFHRGMGLAVGLFLLVEGIVFWQLGTLAKGDAPRLRPILVTFMFGYLTLAAISWRYFFAAPVVTEVLIALCFGLAVWMAGKSVGAETAVA